MPLKKKGQFEPIFHCCHSKLNIANGNEEVVNQNCLEKAMEYLFAEDENMGSEDFLANARRILMQEKTSKVNQRRQEAKQKRRKKRIETKEERIQSLTNKIDKIESILNRTSSEHCH